MEWNGKSDKYFTTSDTGHCICITFHDDRKIYTAWPNNCKADTPLIGISDTFEGAEKLCITHHEQQQQLTAKQTATALTETLSAASA